MANATRTSEARESPWKRRRIIAGLGLAQIVSWGTLYYAFPLVAVPMEAELGLSKPEIYGAATFGLAVGGVAAYPVGTAIDRGYGRAILAAGSAFAALLLLGWSSVTSLAIFYAIFAGIGVAQAMTLYDPVWAVVVQREIGDPRSTITALTLWGGFASTVFVPLTQALLDQLGWRGALVGLAATNLALCVPIHFFVLGPAPAPSSATPPSSNDGPRREVIRAALRNPVFVALAVTFTLYYGAFAALTYHMYPLLLERGFDAPTVVVAMVMIGPAQVAGRVLVWWLAGDRPVRGIGMATVVALAGSVIVLIVLPKSFASLVVFAIVYGGANGVMTIVRGIAVPEMVAKQAYGELNGIIGVPAAIARALAPVAAAALWAVRSSYDEVLTTVLVMALVSMVSFWAAALTARRTA